MKKLNKIIDDLIDFAVKNDVIGDGKIDIKIGNLRVKKIIPILDCLDKCVDEDDVEMEIVEEIMER